MNDIAEQLSIFDCFDFCNEEPFDVLDYIAGFGTGFGRRRERLFKVLSSDMKQAEMVDFLRKEYGIGSFSVYMYTDEVSVAYNGSGMTVEIASKEFEKEYTWSQVYDAVMKRIRSGRYLICDRCCNFIHVGEGTEINGVVVEYRDCAFAGTRQCVDECEFFNDEEITERTPLHGLLNSCPDCGGEPVISTTKDGKYLVECLCRTRRRTFPFRHKNDAINFWNARTSKGACWFHTTEGRD